MVTLLYRAIGTVLLAVRGQGKRPGLLEARKSRSSPGRPLQASSARVEVSERKRTARPAQGFAAPTRQSVILERPSGRIPLRGGLENVLFL